MTFPSDRDVLFGDDAIVDAWKREPQLDGQRVLLVCGKRSFDSSGAAKCLPVLNELAQVRRWSEFRANTDARDLIEGLRLVEEFAPDVILGIGGGSAMDMAKLLCAYQGITDETVLHEAIRAGAAVTSRRMNLILAPTTSGSGSEATHFAVVYIGDNKFSIAGPAMLPDTVILDPLLTLSATPYQRATSGIDAVAQAVESLWATGATEQSRGFAVAALELLIDALPRFVAEGTAASAGDMARGAHLAGRAIDVSKTTAAHAMSYGITKTHGVPHGHAVALTLGGFIAAHGIASPADLQPAVTAESHAAAMSAICAAFGVATPAQAKEAFVALAERIGLTMKLPEVGVTTREQVADLTKRVNVERMGNNPVRFTVDGLTEMIAGSL